ncbi:Geranylgeranyl transferase type-2 subunit alpha [Lasiodiplodia hormozganensis]|uniref:Geranylgeranyl transferase type-2 subunit alpha n=1 Tax=Lasiodiplodia hormozganensis TaxID=869390 RepID=A0AA39Z0B8_9PEZI|nr:Geranylgeranyl transferase type-2 subunit alpha [Lasiodiplodia hormozganensis]
MASHGAPRSQSLQHRSEQQKQKELEQIGKYNELVAEVNAKIAATQYTPESLALVSKLLAQNPEYYTIWNHRRLILDHMFKDALASSPSAEEELSSGQQTVLDYITNDLHFLVPLIMKFPKCYWIWNHRIWLLQQSTELLPTSYARRLWQEELGLVGKMLSRDSRNFHGWNYRRLVVSNLEQLDGQHTSMVEPEFEYTTKMIKTNLSNFSAWHNRSKLIPRLLDERNADGEARQKFMKSELDLIQGALYTDPYDQSLWFYHAFLMATLDQNSPRNARIVQDVDDGVRAKYLEAELDTIREMLDGAEDCKWIYQALLETAAALKVAKQGEDAGLATEMAEWLSQLKHLDPLRSARWDDLSKKLKL